MIALKKAAVQVERWQLVISCQFDLKYMFRTASSHKFISVRSDLSLWNERLLPVSPKVKGEHCDRHLSRRFTKELQLKSLEKQNKKKE